MIPAADAPTLELRDASLALGGRELWSDLDLQLRAGAFLAVLGPNGAGKSSLIRAILGEVRLRAGSIRILGAARSVGTDVGYIPQQRLFDRGVGLRARDLVGFGLDGHRLGLPVPTRERRGRIDEALARTGAESFADAPMGSLSGGEQQRVRIAQALISRPRLLLCDEPLLSLDPGHQVAVTEAIDDYRRETGAAVVFVTHDVNPILDRIDQVLYLGPRGHRLGVPRDVLTTDVLSDLYDVHVDVLDVHGRIIVVAGTGDGDHLVLPAHSESTEHPASPVGRQGTA
ncbi:metal ABC transporter ATP-binding protein [Naasia lichenicola]|uniref:ABC transporter ATP-binding protein n=1 Tax=Naasia lichenicola TaxID=2565933 RepID=A0A4S4FH78_9MICO|nr:ABC transporter ATP-binding protein [Naasia lichenicola]THG29491.1 ABC transporter ATP-binding protein [Naasia lichenicola]